MFGACVLLVYLPVNVGIVEFLRARCVVMPGAGGEGAPTVETPTLFCRMYRFRRNWKPKEI